MTAQAGRVQFMSYPPQKRGFKGARSEKTPRDEKVKTMKEVIHALKFAFSKYDPPLCHLVVNKLKVHRQHQYNRILTKDSQSGFPSGSVLFPPRYAGKSSELISFRRVSFQPSG
ncbi:hypothetical protein AVEN_145848-1 [Araneus ventricosus]|uniref:Uncharacterized protein n=1 Tax=Araneus ventricosus TaxID=182803 RepID=A0A4Y2CGC6_ARAVE|nr:hypothetical protein AVEN_145848-1 [Araneus ventricosus]